jgi:hypothetical protein
MVKAAQAAPLARRQRRPLALGDPAAARRANRSDDADQHGSSARQPYGTLAVTSRHGCPARGHRVSGAPSSG